MIKITVCMSVLGISFLSYPGAAYAAQVLDGSAVPSQSLLPGVGYSVVMTTAVQSQPHYSQPVTSTYRLTEHLSADKNIPVANAVPVLSAVNQATNEAQPVQLKQPLQSINLTDLLDYSFLMEHGMSEAAGTVDLRNPAVLANMIQSLNAASVPSADERSTQAFQPVDIRQFPAAKQTVPNQQPFQESVTVNSHQQVPLSNQQLPTGQLYASQGTVASTAPVLQSSQQKGAVQAGSGVMWPWTDQLSIHKSQNDAVQPVSVATSLSSVSYEAVSPPAVSVDNMSFSLLDNLQFTGDAAGGYQLSSFLGSTVDPSAIFTAAPYSLALTSQQSRTDLWGGSAVTSSSFSATSDARLQPSLELNERSTSNVPLTTFESAVSRQPGVELEKVLKQKSNLGIVMPMPQSSREERSAVTSQAASCRTTSVSGDTEQQSQYLTNSQASAEKSSGPVADTASGGIVLTNITGNVYVNQYTMMPGGGQPLDSTLLHADLPVGGAVGSLSYDTVVDEMEYPLAAPSVAVMMNTTDDELNTFAAPSLASIATVQQPKHQPHSAQPATRKQPAPESSFFGADAEPVLAAKPSNKFESCFLQFICGHKAETLSSVLNSPIKTRPVLPKYIPEPHRPKPAEPPVEESEDKVVALSESSLVTVSESTVQSPTSSASVTSVCFFLYFI